MRGESREGRIAKRKQRVIGAAVFVGLVAIALFLFLKGTTSRSSADVHITAGAASLDRALKGEAAAWDDAEHHFQRAAGGGLLGFERYPIFCLSTTHRLRALTPLQVPKAEVITRIEGVDVLVVAGKRDQARQTLVRLSSSSDEKVNVQANLYLRLLTDLDVAAHGQSGAPPSPGAGD